MSAFDSKADIILVGTFRFHSGLNLILHPIGRYDGRYFLVI